MGMALLNEAHNRIPPGPLVSNVVYGASLDRKFPGLRMNPGRPVDGVLRRPMTDGRSWLQGAQSILLLQRFSPSPHMPSPALTQTLPPPSHITQASFASRTIQSTGNRPWQHIAPTSLIEKVPASGTQSWAIQSAGQLQAFSPGPHSPFPQRVQA